MSSILVYNQGFFFPLGLRIFGCTLMLFGAGVFTSLYENNPLIVIIISIFLGILGLCFFATKYLIIDKEESVIYDEMRLLGMKFKSDVKLENYCYITMLKQLYSQTSSNRYMPDTTSYFGKYDVVLLNKPHHLKLKIGSFNSYDEAMMTAKELSEYLAFEIVKFNPIRKKRN